MEPGLWILLGFILLLQLCKTPKNVFWLSLTGSLLVALGGFWFLGLGWAFLNVLAILVVGQLAFLQLLTLADLWSTPIEDLKTLKG